jgi:hypothetical protein
MGASQFVLTTKYYLGDAIRDGMCGHPANMENVRNAYKIFRIQHEMKRPFGKAMNK